MSPGAAPSELRFDAWRKRVGMLAGPAALLVIWVVPLPLGTDAHRLAAIMGLVGVWWISEAVPLSVTAMFGTALAVLAGISSPAGAFAPFAHPIIFLTSCGWTVTPLGPKSSTVRERP